MFLRIKQKNEFFLINDFNEFKTNKKNYKTHRHDTLL